MTIAALAILAFGLAVTAVLLWRAQRELAVARAAAARVESRLALTRSWNEELRERIQALDAEKGVLADTSDIRALVLRTALTLLGADKGLLLSRTDEDRDGDLDLLCADGFEHDPEHSALAQHLAARVLDRYVTVRVDHPDELALDGRTPADDEIENLVAIPIYVRDRFRGVVVCANRPGGFGDFEDDVLLALGDQAGTALHNARLRGEVRSSYLATVRVLADAVEAKDRALRGHANDVTAGVLAVADRLGIEPQRREQLVFASLLHDIGKLAISERILLKPGPLTPEEREAVEQHPRIGYRLIVRVPALREMGPGVLHHHERWDGAGYPDGLHGDEIPLEARLIAVADAFSAMREQRPYRDAISLEAACEELERSAGTQFDPAVVELFVDEVRRHPPESVAGPFQEAVGEREEAVSRAEGALLGDGAISAVDNLTLLYGHRFLHELAAAEAGRAGVDGPPFAAVLVTLADLPRRNRDAGYAAGDAMLVEVAECVRRVAAHCGGTAARESGAHLCLLVPDADDALAGRLAAELAQELAGRDVRIGTAVWRPGDTGESVLARARSAAARPSRARRRARSRARSAPSASGRRS